MTKEKMIEQAIFKALSNNPITSNRLKIKARNVAIDDHYDTEIIDSILNLTKEEVRNIILNLKKDNLIAVNNQGYYLVVKQQ
jgi:hypothetical protein